MPKFDKKYVHFMWSDELKGKVCVLEDYIGELQVRVEQHDEKYIHTVIDKYNANYPFYTQGREHFSFCYYDPYYDMKVAFEQGKKIECKRKGDAWGDLDWDYTPSPAWLDDYEYRIQSEENIVTNRELARWLAQGKGEYRDIRWTSDIRVTYYTYEKDHEQIKDILIRKWEDEEWHEPTREYMGLED